MLANLQTSASVPRNTVIGFKVYDPRLRFEIVSMLSGPLLINVSCSFPPKNAKVSTSQGNARNIAHPAVAFYPTSVLAQSEIWDEKVRLPLRKPTFKKKNIDERKSQVCTRYLPSRLWVSHDVIESGARDAPSGSG